MMFPLNERGRQNRKDPIRDGSMKKRLFTCALIFLSLYLSTFSSPPHDVMNT